MAQEPQIFTVPAEEWVVRDIIGSGGSAIVHECTKKGDSSPVLAIKRFRDPITASTQEKIIDDEVENIRRINHIHVIRVRGVTYYDEGWRRYCDIIIEPRAVGRNKNLQEYLDDEASEFQDFIVNRGKRRTRMLSEMICFVSTLHHIHALGIRHRDIKLENKGITETYNAG